MTSGAIIHRRDRKMFRKDRAHPITVTEYMAECRRDTDTWRKWPARMLRHKAAIQAARYAFGFSGIYEEDEISRIQDAAPAARQMVDVTPAAERPAGRPSRLASIVHQQGVTVPPATVPEQAPEPANVSASDVPWSDDKEEA